MKILITGNMGYFGPGAVSKLREVYPDGELIGFNTGYFAHGFTNFSFMPETKLNRQIFSDVRNFDPEILNEIDAVA